MILRLVISAALTLTLALFAVQQFFSPEETVEAGSESVLEGTSQPTRTLPNQVRADMEAFEQQQQERADSYDDAYNFDLSSQ